jgi:glycerate 2-kinase
MKFEKDLRAIYQAAVQRIHPQSMFSKAVSLSGSLLMIEGQKVPIDLQDFEHIYLLGAGKASAQMAKSLEQILKDYPISGCIAVKPGHEETLHSIEQIPAGHPVPNEGSIQASQKILEIARRAGEKDLVLVCISGGGSALMTLPDERIGLSEYQDLTRELLEKAVPIDGINCIRKQISQVKGGGLARAIHPATFRTFLLSDVLGDAPGDIASGPTVPNTSLRQDALSFVEEYGLQLPESVGKVLSGPEKNSASEPWPPGENILLGSNRQALEAAAEAAEKLGYETEILSNRIEGEAREVAKVLFAIHSYKQQTKSRPLCILSGGETTVTIRGKGKGGRNQELALSYQKELMKNPLVEAAFLSAGSDGNDGPTDAAGGFAASELQADYADLIGALAENDSYHMLSSMGALFSPGPTGTNVCDFQIFLSKPEINARTNGKV